MTLSRDSERVLAYPADKYHVAYLRHVSPHQWVNRVDPHQLLPTLSQVTTVGDPARESIDASHYPFAGINSDR